MLVWVCRTDVGCFFGRAGAIWQGRICSLLALWYSVVEF